RHRAGRGGDGHRQQQRPGGHQVLDAHPRCLPPNLAMRSRPARANGRCPVCDWAGVDMPPSMTDAGPCAPNPGPLTDIVTGVNSVAVSGQQAPRVPGARLVKAGAIAFLAVVASWVIYALLSGRNGALDPVDLTVYRDGGLIVRQVRPYYDPHATA